MFATAAQGRNLAEVGRWELFCQKKERGLDLMPDVNNLPDQQAASSVLGGGGVTLPPHTPNICAVVAAFLKV